MISAYGVCWSKTVKGSRGQGAEYEPGDGEAATAVAIGDASCSPDHEHDANRDRRDQGARCARVLARTIWK